MLNKAVCKQCKNQQIRSDGTGGWDHWNDKYWEAEFVSCGKHGAVTRDEDGRTRPDINDEPPSWCPYSAEHAVAPKNTTKADICRRCFDEGHRKRGAPVPNWVDMKYYNQLWGHKVCGVDDCPYEAELAVCEEPKS